VVPPGSEAWRCKIGQISNETLAHVNRVESVQTEGMHHMDVMSLIFTGLDLPPGDYDCTELYEAHPELMQNGLTLFAAQAARSIVNLPEGTVASLPPKMAALHEIHYVNTTDKEVKVSSRVNAYTIPQEQVKARIWGGAVRDVNINIPPRASHEEWTRCVMNQDVDVIFLASHTHQLGRRVTIAPFDGTTVGEVIYENTEWENPALKDFSKNPLRLKKGQGFEFRCYFQSTRDEMVNWGFKASDEMCQIAIVHTPGDVNTLCEPVASSDGKL
jgi:hypothetical protein